MRTAGYCPGELKGQAKRRGNKKAGDRRRQKEIIDCLFPLYLFTYCFSLLFSLSLIPSPQTSAPWVTSWQTTRGGCRLFSYPLFSRFFCCLGYVAFLQPGNHLGTPGKWTEATQMLISPWPPSDMHWTPPAPSKSLPLFFHLFCPKSQKSHWRQQSVSWSLLIKSFLIEEDEEVVADRGERCFSRLQ